MFFRRTAVDAPCVRKMSRGSSPVGSVPLFLPPIYVDRRWFVQPDRTAVIPAG